MMLNEFSRRMFLGTPLRPAPSPGPWRMRETKERSPYARDGYERVYVVLDANDKCVAQCESAVDADFIVRHGPAAATKAVGAEIDAAKTIP